MMSIVWSTSTRTVGSYHSPARDPTTAGQDLGALGLGVGDVPLDRLDLGAEAHRPDVVPGAATLPDRPGPLHDEIDEPVVDGVLDVHPLDGHAGLAGVHEGAPHRAGGGELDVGVVAHDHRILATELEQHRRQGLGRRRHHQLAGGDRAGERDLLHTGADEGIPGAAAPGHDLHEVGMGVGLGEQPADLQAHQGGDLGGLEYHGVAG
jgi:hypothetical protein